MTDTVNAQITDAVTQTNVKVLGEAPAQSMALVSAFAAPIAAGLAAESVTKAVESFPKN